MSGNGFPPPYPEHPPGRVHSKKSFLEWCTTPKLVVLLLIPSFTAIVVVATLFGAK